MARGAAGVRISGAGRPNRWPCPYPQPSAVMAATSASLSMPSAMTLTPFSVQIDTMDRHSAALRPVRRIGSGTLGRGLHAGPQADLGAELEIVPAPLLDQIILLVDGFTRNAATAPAGAQVKLCPLYADHLF
jgi:hypothetical protein